ncbi:MAG TPA: FtsX-like permease family protein, partial [Streptosporangiaceae bacterium]|nr:FtsX-like permease family protein [Streptosporangiaceae bacterium]
RVSAAGRGLTSALAGWQFSRQPLRQGGAALLLVMAVGTGTLALDQHQSWTRSAADQAAYVTGGDAQVNLAGPQAAGATTSFTGAAGVRAAMAVSVNQTTPAPVVAIDAAQGPRVARLRADQSSLPPAALLRSITPSSPSGGLLISGRPRSVRFTVTLSRAPLDSVSAQFTVTDATGAAFQLSSALFSADGRPHVLTAALGGTDAAYPLRLSQVILNYTLPAKPLKTPVTLTIAGATPTTWTAAASSPQLVSELSTNNMYGPSASPHVTGWRRAPGGAALTFAPGYGQWSQAPGASPVLTEPVAGQVSLSAPATVPAAVPAIATRAFDNVNNSGVGSTVQTTVNGITVPAKIVAVASAFPTITGAGLVMDLPTLEAFLVSHGAPPVAVTQWWLATTGGRVPASLARALPPGATVTSSAALAAATVADPLSAAPQQALLAMAVAAALLAISGFWVSIAASVRQRRAENALLAALGVSQRSAAAQLLLEKLLFSIPAAALGLLLGTVVARLLVPAVTLSPTAQLPVPPPVTLFDLPQTIPLAVAVAVLPALAAALVIFRRPDPAAQLRAAEAA